MQPILWNDERITAYVLGELSADEASRLESEMQSSVELTQAVDEARRITSQLASMFANEPAMSLDSIKREEILTAPVVQNADVECAQSTGFSFRPIQAWALAATILLLGTLGTIAYRAEYSKQEISTQVAMGRANSSPQKPTSAKPVETSKNLMQASEAPQSITTETLPANTPMAKSPVVTLSRTASRDDATQQESQSAVAVDSLMLQSEMTVKSKEAPLASLQERSENFAKDEAMSIPAAIPPASAPVQAAPASPATSEMRFGEADRSVGEFHEYGSGMGAYGAGQSQSGMAAVGDRSPYFESPAMGIEARGVDAFADFGMSPTETDQPFIATAPRKQEELERNSSLAMEGQGPGNAGDRFEPISENGFRRVNEAPLSTFSIDVDTASYSKVRQFLTQANTLPPAGAIRIEELVNYFDYQYEPPAENSEHPFVSRVEVADCPWTVGHRLARVAIKGKVIANEKRPSSNLVFLVDTSGSMSEPNKLPLVKDGLRKLTERLGKKDRIAIVVYAGSAGLALDSTLATERSTIMRKLNQLQSGGSTNGGEGIRLAYQVARDHFIDGGVNRVILCSDGDFNVGTTSNDELVRLVETEAKGGIDITVLGFGMGNHNDSMMEQVSGRGNGTYAFIDTESEANRVLVEQISSTLVTIARDVKIQVEFNPSEVAAYRLIGYENRALANEDFKDDTKDAGEIGAGHSVTALYELIPADGDIAALSPAIDELRYQKTLVPTDGGSREELMNVKLRYKKPDSDQSTAVEFPVVDKELAFDQATGDFRFAASVAGFGMLLRSSEHSGKWTLSDVEAIASQAKGADPNGYRAEFLELVRMAAKLRSQER